MDIVVTIRQTAILRGEPVFTYDEKSVDIAMLKRHINEWDLYALEEALRIKASNGAKVTIVSVGDKKTEEAMYYGLAAGVDETILIEKESQGCLDSWQIATLLARVISVKPYDLVLTGVQSEDDGCAEVGAILSRMLNIPQAGTIMNIELLVESETIEVHRELEDGFSDIQRLRLPALLNIQTGINQPRYISSMRLRSTKKKRSITIISPASMGINISELAPKKIAKKLYTPEIGSAKLEFIEGANPTEKATNLVDRLYNKGVL